MYPAEAFKMLTQGITRMEMIRSVLDNGELTYRLINEDIVTDEEERKIIFQNFDNPGLIKSLYHRGKVTPEELQIIYDRFRTNTRNNNYKMGLFLIGVMNLKQEEILDIMKKIISSNDEELLLEIISNKNLYTKLGNEFLDPIMEYILKSSNICLRMLNKEKGYRIGVRRAEMMEKALISGTNAYTLFVGKRYIDDKERQIMFDKIINTKTHLNNMIKSADNYLNKEILTTNDITKIAKKVVETKNFQAVRLMFLEIDLNEEQKELLEPLKLMMILTK